MLSGATVARHLIISFARREYVTDGGIFEIIIQGWLQVV